MNCLFIMEQWCDCNPACGVSGTHEYYLNTWRSLHLGRAFVVHYDNHPVDETIRNALAISKRNPIDLVVYTEVGGHPSAQVHALWPQFSARGIPVVAIWHDTVSIPSPDKDGVRLNVMVDTPQVKFPVRNSMGSWTPHDTSLFFDGHWDRDIDVLFPSSRAHKPLAAEWVVHIERAGIPVYWTGGQREQRLGWYEYAGLFRRAKIVINFCQNSPGGFQQMKGRVTEAIYSGCLLLEQTNPYTEALLRSNVDCVYFGSPKELVEKIRFYLARDDERIKIAESGRGRAFVDYSPSAWWYRVFSKIGLA